MNKGLKTFIIIWVGQFASLFGSALTRFALTVWIYQETGSATALTTGGFFAMAPTFLLLPIGGALADRWDRKKVMIAADMIGGLCTVFILSLYMAGNLLRRRSLPIPRLYRRHGDDRPERAFRPS
jgi:DHA3 family macrolide efflux protein-like MFS transporter